MDEPLLDLATIFLLPFVGHHPEWYPRLRAAYLEDPEHPEYKGYIQVLTYTGGEFLEEFEDHVTIVQNDPLFVTLIDNHKDSSAISFVFECAPELKEDFEKVTVHQDFKGTSDLYKHRCRHIFRESLEIQAVLNEIFGDVPTSA